MKKLLLIVVLLFGICIPLVLGVVTHTGGNNTYQSQLSDGLLAVTDTRTGEVRVFKVRDGERIQAFSSSDRIIQGY